jgi:hypothetical protein
MKTTIFIVSCAGVLLVVLSMPAGKALYRWHVDTGGVDTGERSFRLTFIVVGTFLTLLSFFLPFLPDR